MKDAGDPFIDLASPFLKVAASCIKRRITVRVSPDQWSWRNSVEKIETERHGVAFSLGNRDLLLKSHSAKLGIELSDKTLCTSTRLNETTQRALIGSHISALADLPGASLIDARITAFEPNGKGHKVAIRSPRLDFAAMLTLANEIDQLHRGRIR